MTNEKTGVMSCGLQVTSLYILDFGLWIWDLNQFRNPHSLAQTFCNTIKVSPDPVYKMINIVLWSPLRQGGLQSEMSSFCLLASLFARFFSCSSWFEALILGIPGSLAHFGHLYFLCFGFDRLMSHKPRPVGR